MDVFSLMVMLSELHPVLRGVLIGVFGIGSWIVGLAIAYLLYRRYRG
ncbi:hypothetical protein RH858_01235 [Halalkaliarchaeum sp. AArc-GB]|nr:MULTISPECIES: hypothetical protein [unclassified Halalkaliarchaeum]MDR5671777.1 hypothetical protein [Halalkaliarchaeum sp. AArc-GB]